MTEERSIRICGTKRVPNPLGFTDDVYDTCDDCGAEYRIRNCTARQIKKGKVRKMGRK